MELGKTLFRAYVACLILFLVGGLVYPIFFDLGSGLETPFIRLNAGSIILTSGIVLVFVVTHIATFTRRANEAAISTLAALYLIYFFLAFLYLLPENGAGWVRLFAFFIIFLGVELAVPDWPLRFLEALKARKKRM